MYRRIIKYIKQIEKRSKSPAYCSARYKAGDFHNPVKSYAVSRIMVIRAFLSDSTAGKERTRTYPYSNVKISFSVKFRFVFGRVSYEKRND